MLLIHFKSTHIFMKIVIILNLLLPFIGSGLIIFSSIENSNLWLYGSIVILISFLLFTINFFYSKISIGKLINPLKGIATKNHDKFIYMNIYFKREIFTRKNFLEYKEYYNNFYRKIHNKIKDPFI